MHPKYTFIGQVKSIRHNYFIFSMLATDCNIISSHVRMSPNTRWDLHTSTSSFSSSKPSRVNISPSTTLSNKCSPLVFISTHFSSALIWVIVFLNPWGTTTTKSCWPFWLFADNSFKFSRTSSSCSFYPWGSVYSMANFNDEDNSSFLCRNFSLICKHLEILQLASPRPRYPCPWPRYPFPWPRWVWESLSLVIVGILPLYKGYLITIFLGECRQFSWRSGIICLWPTWKKSY